MSTISFLDHDYMDAILENVRDGIYIADREANTVYINHSYELISGLVRTELLGRNMRDLVAEGVISVSGTLSVLESGKSVTVEQSFHTGKRAIITSSPVYADDETKKNIIMVVTVVREITEIYTIRREIQRLTAQNRQLANEVEQLTKELTGNVPLVAVNASSIRILRLAERVSLVDTLVLISGEKGVGKEKLAQHIHSRSKRKMFPFIRIDWSMMPQDDPVKYLFGYVNPHTNAYVPGVLENADGGTVFVDELLQMPNVVRPFFLSLLRGDTSILGDGTMRRLNVRLIFSSAFSYQQLKDIKQVEEEILQYLSAFCLEILPLRERREDIIPLLDYFLKQYNQKTGEQKTFSRACYKTLLNYDWPENVREVRMLTVRTAIVSGKDVIEESDLMLNVRQEEYGATGDKLKDQAVENVEPFVLHPGCSDLKYESARLEAYYMIQAYRRYGNIRDAAASLDIDSSTFVRKRQRYRQMGLMTEDE